MHLSNIYYLTGILLLSSITLAGCSTRSQPAPVVSLSTKTASKQNLAVIDGNTYTVEKGDTLFAIAFYSGNDYRDIAKYNQLKPPYQISIGQTLSLIPRASSASKATNIDLAHVGGKLDNKTVDPTIEPAYGGNKPTNHRKNQKNKSDSSKIPYKKVAKGSGKTKSTWIWPAYGKHTIATVGSDGSKRGLDIKGLLGSTIIAAADGKVVYAGNALKGYGNLVIIKHNDQYLSAYAHNQSILVSEQSYVKQGQQIATMGNSGSSEVMLHFEIRKKGKSVDPFTYLPR